MQLKPTVSLYLDIRKLLKSNKFALKVRVTFNVGGKFIQKYYSTGKELSVEQWKKMKSSSVPFSLRKPLDEIRKLEARAVDIVTVNPTIKPDLFDALFSGKYSKSSGLSILFDEVIAKLEENGQIGTASSYRCAKNSLIEYSGDFPLEVVDVDFLENYERWMSEQREEKNEEGETVIIRPKGKTTIGIYLRAFRAIFNIAIDKKKMISRDLYPFGRGKYVIPKGSAFKRALKKDDKVKFEQAVDLSEDERRNVAFWMFSYYCNGMNLVDMAFLRPEQIQEELLVIIRRKTMRTVRELKQIVIPLRDEAKQTLKEYGIHAPYVFGIIDDTMNEKQKFNRIKDWRKEINQTVKKVAARLGIKGKVTMYNARHTFATVLLQGKVDIKAIQDSLGHRSISTTENYLADLDIDQAKKLSKLL